MTDPTPIESTTSSSRPTDPPRRVDLAKRLLLGIGGPALTAALIVGPIVAWSGPLPDPLNISWDAAGRPKNPASLDRYLGLQAAFATICSLGFVVGAVRPLTRGIANATAAVIAGAVAPILAVATTSTLLANNGERSWTDVDAPGFGWLLVSLSAALLGAAASGWLTRDLLLSTVDGPRHQPSAGLDLGESRTASWHSGSSARWPIWTAIGTGVTGLVLLTATVRPFGALGTLLGLGALLIGAAALVFATIRVNVDRHGLTISYGWLPWPRSRVALDAIAAAEAIDVDPRDHGGWGYRGSRLLFKKAAVVVRRGEGLRLTLRNGGEFVVTVDNAEQGAGVLNDIRAARTTT